MHGRIISLSFFINVFVPSFHSALSDRIGIVMESIEINVFLRHMGKSFSFPLFSLEIKYTIWSWELKIKYIQVSVLTVACHVTLTNKPVFILVYFFIVRKKH